MEGVSLADVHLSLMKAGYGAAREWGTYGPQTTANVKRFQQAVGHPETGVIDEATWAVLKQYHRE